MALANAEMGAKYVSLSTVESDPSLAQAERKVGRAWEQLSGMGGAQVSSHSQPPLGSAQVDNRTGSKRECSIERFTGVSSVECSCGESKLKAPSSKRF